MSGVKTKDGTKLYTLDWGTGAPVVLIHGWPLSSSMWEYQMAELPKHGLRVIAYDRRGFGASGKPWGGYDYDTFADDLAAVLDHHDVKDATLVGFSMGGGEVARYMSRHAGKRVARAVLMSAVTPLIAQTPDNPDGFPRKDFDGMISGMSNDRPGFLTEFSKSFFGAGLLTSPVSNPYIASYCEDAMRATGHATRLAAEAWYSTNFNGDLPSFKVPTLILHGDKDQTVPINLTARKAHAAIAGSRLKVYEGAPHGMYYTHREQLNRDLIAFARGSAV